MRDTRPSFIDIDWKRYDFARHLNAVRRFGPCLTIARDVEDMDQLDTVLSQAYQLLAHSCHVVVVPKAAELESEMDRIPGDFMLGFSVPTRYGGTQIKRAAFDRPVHLLGGRPDVQRKMAEDLRVFSLDCNRFTLDAQFGDYFDGQTFRPHPVGGYEACLRDSVENINRLWSDYSPAVVARRCERCPWPEAV